MFSLEGVTKTYTGRRGSVDALRDVTLKVETGSFLTVTGPSGSGKTTLLLTLGGLIRVTSGRVGFKDTELSRLSEGRLAEYRSRKVGFVLQTFNLIPYLSALENVMVPMVFANGTAPRHAERAMTLLGRVDLADRANHLPRELSVGQQQRVAIARALGNDPEVILADEPTGNLDPALSRGILGILRELNEKEGRTVVMVTHSPEAAQMGSHHLRLEEGRCVGVENREVRS
jgi:putative ABC transport system ATP-binding protein